MKKRFFIILLICFLLLGCEIQHDELEFSKEEVKSEGEFSTPGGEKTENEEGTENEEETESGEEEKEEITFSEMIAADTADCKIKITDVKEDRLWGYEIQVELENKSTDTEQMFSLEYLSVNGVECSCWMASSILPGKKSVEKISVDDSDLKDNSVGLFTDIEMGFRVYDNNDWLADDILNQTVHIYPYGKERAEAFVRQSKDSDLVLVDNESVTVIATGYREDTVFHDFEVNLYLVNKTEENIMYSVRDCSVNGYMIDPFFATSLHPGKSKFSTISWSYSAFEENGIDDVEVIEFLLTAYDEDSWSDEFANEAVELRP